MLWENTEILGLKVKGKGYKVEPGLGLEAEWACVYSPHPDTIVKAILFITGRDSYKQGLSEEKQAKRSPSPERAFQTGEFPQSTQRGASPCGHRLLCSELKACTGVLTAKSPAPGRSSFYLTQSLKIQMNLGHQRAVVPEDRLRGKTAALP